MANRINWTQGYDAAECDGAAVQITDGIVTVYAPLGGHSLRSACADYAETYGFNFPGEIDARASLFVDGGETDAERFSFTDVDRTPAFSR